MVTYWVSVTVLEAVWSRETQGAQIHLACEAESEERSGSRLSGSELFPETLETLGSHPWRQFQGLGIWMSP